MLAVCQDPKVFRIRKIPLSFTLALLKSVEWLLRQVWAVVFEPVLQIFTFRDVFFLARWKTPSSLTNVTPRTIGERNFLHHITNSSLTGEPSDVQPSGYMYLSRDFMQILCLVSQAQLVGLEFSRESSNQSRCHTNRCSAAWTSSVFMGINLSWKSRKRGREGGDIDDVIIMCLFVCLTPSVLATLIQWQEQTWNKSSWLPILSWKKSSMPSSPKTNGLLKNTKNTM